MSKKSYGYLFVLFLLSACAGIPLTETPIATETYVAVDGFATASVFTWEDINGNGVVDEGEPPLPFVTTSIAYPDILTATDGWATASEFMAGCSENCWSGEIVSVKVPPGYKPTTPTYYDLTRDESQYYFGFSPNANEKSFYFSNEPDWQKAFINRGTRILAFHYSDSGQLQITLDKEGTVSDDYYPEGFLTDRHYFDVFVFNVILDLGDWHNVSISEVQITLTPDMSMFSCKKSDIDEWTGRISGYEILTQYCTHEQ